MDSIAKYYFSAGCLARNDNSFFVRNIRELRMSTSDPFNDYIFIRDVFTSDIFAGVTHLYLRMGTMKKIETTGNTFSFHSFPDLRHLRSLTHLIVDGFVSAVDIEVHHTITHLQVCPSPEYALSSSPRLFLDIYPALSHLMFNADVDRRWQGKVEQVLASLRNDRVDCSVRCIAVVISNINASFEAAWSGLREIDPRLVLVNCGPRCARDDVMEADKLLPQSFDFWEQLETFVTRRSK